MFASYFFNTETLVSSKSNLDRHPKGMTFAGVAAFTFSKRHFSTKFEVCVLKYNQKKIKMKARFKINFL